MANRILATFVDTAEFADCFDELPLWSAPFGLLMLQHLKCGKGLTVLDLGSGTGFPILEIAQRFGPTGTYYSLDTWASANQRSRKKADQYGLYNLKVLESSADAIPLGDSTVDLIVSNLGLNNFDNLEQVLGECFRVLKHGGSVSIATNLNGHWAEFYRVFGETLAETGRQHSLASLNGHQEKRGSVSSINSIFASAGFLPSKAETGQFEMKFTDGTSFMGHHFIQMGWFAGWAQIVGEAVDSEFFDILEANLNSLAAQHGALVLTVPMAFLEFVKPAP